MASLSFQPTLRSLCQSSGVKHQARKPPTIQNPTRAQLSQNRSKMEREVQWKIKIALEVPLYFSFPHFPLKVFVGKFGVPLLVRHSEFGQDVQLLVVVGTWKWVYEVPASPALCTMWEFIVKAAGWRHHKVLPAPTDLVNNLRKMEVLESTASSQQQPMPPQTIVAVRERSSLTCPIVYAKATECKVDLDAEEAPPWLQPLEFSIAVECHAINAFVTSESKFYLTTDVVEKGSECDCLLVVPTPKQGIVARVQVDFEKNRTYGTLLVQEEDTLMYATEGGCTADESDEIFRLPIPKVEGGSSFSIRVTYFLPMPFVLDQSMLMGHTSPSCLLSISSAVNTGLELERETGPFSRRVQETEPGPGNATSTSGVGKAEQLNTDFDAAHRALSMTTGVQCRHTRMVAFETTKQLYQEATEDAQQGKKICLEKYAIRGQVIAVGRPPGVSGYVPAVVGNFSSGRDDSSFKGQLACCGSWEENNVGCWDCDIALAARMPLLGASQL